MTVKFRFVRVHSRDNESQVDRCSETKTFVTVVLGSDKTMENKQEKRTTRLTRKQM
jgi:RNase H-fold protein (predicted Holliday junction resolvase)